MPKTYIRTKTNGHMHFSSSIGELLGHVQITKTFDGKQYQTPAIIIKTDTSIFTIVLESPRVHTTVEIITKDEYEKELSENKKYEQMMLEYAIQKNKDQTYIYNRTALMR